MKQRSEHHRRVARGEVEIGLVANALRILARLAACNTCAAGVARDERTGVEVPGAKPISAYATARLAMISAAIPTDI